MDPATTPHRRRVVQHGGWSAYQEWAGRDFRPREPAEETGTGAVDTVVVEVLTQLSPVTLPDWYVERVAAQAPETCRWSPSHDHGGSACTPECEVEAAPVRPYVRAGGRAEPAHELRFETVITATGRHEDWSGDRELDEDQLRICAHCASPQSVAEVAVAIDAPIGVAKVLIGDALDRGLLELHEDPPSHGGRPTLALLKRVHESLARLA